MQSSGRTLGNERSHPRDVREVATLDANVVTDLVEPLARLPHEGVDIMARTDEGTRHARPDEPRRARDEHPHGQWCLTAQSYGMWFSNGSSRSLREGSCGCVQAFATIACGSLIPLNPFQTPGGITTRL